MSKQLNIKLNLFAIVNRSIDTQDYTNQEFDTIADKCKYALSCFESEYDNPYEQKRTPNYTKRVAGWLQGLPSVITIPFWNDEIVKIGYDLGMIKKVVRQTTQEKEEQKFIDQWFELMAHKLIQMSTMGKHAESQLVNFLKSEEV